MTSPPNRLLQERRLGAGALSLILLGQCIAAVLPLVFFRCTMVRSKWSSSIFHEPVGDGRQRDIFPIPSLDAGHSRTNLNGGDLEENKDKKFRQKAGGERDLEGAKIKRDENPVQDQPKWWRAGRILRE